MTTPTTPPASAGRLLRRSFGRNRGRLVGSYTLLSLWQLCETMVPVLIGVLIDRAVAPSDAGALFFWGAALVVLFGCLSFAYRYGARLGFGVVQREMHRLRVEIATHALHPRGLRSTSTAGETLSLATSDVDQVGTMIRSVGYTVASAMAVLVSAWFLLRLDVTLGLVVLLGVPLVLVLIQVVTPAISRRSREQQASVARASGVATDLVRGIRVLKGVGAEDVAGARYRRHSQLARAASIRTADSRGMLTGLTTGLSGLFLAVVALLAGRMALEGELTIGELIAIVGLTQFLAEPISALGEISAQLAGAHASAGRIVEFLQSPWRVRAGELSPADSAPTLTISGVSTGPLHRLDLRSRPGELLGLVVEDPSESAALIRLLNAETPEDQLDGDVRLDGLAFHELSTEARRRRLIVNPHHADLFEGILRDNLDPGGRHPGGLEAILAASAADDVVDLRPEGLSQPVSPNGSTYSGGQRQRIALARALASEIPMLVLHDPTTAVDAVTEQRIAEGIRALRHGPGSTLTTWVLTSSPALLDRADRVVMLEGGAVVAEGSHSELAAVPAYQAAVLR